MTSDFVSQKVVQLYPPNLGGIYIAENSFHRWYKAKTMKRVLGVECNC